MKEVLVVLPTPRDQEALKNSGEQYRLHWLDDPDFSYPRPNPGFDLVRYTERCSTYIGQYDIQAVLYSHDLANLVAGVLCDRHELPGPTFESMFLTNHKYYSRYQELDPIWFDYIDLETGSWGNGSPKFPCYIKPPLLMLSLLQHTITSPEALQVALATIKRELPPWSKLFRKFFSAYLDLDRYPLATRDIVVVEELVEDDSQHVIEGWVNPDGKTYIWALADSEYFPGPQRAIDAFYMPSRLPKNLQEKMAAYAIETVQSHGIRNGFWNVELWRQGEQLLITEVNGRIAALWQQLYEGTYHKSLYKAMLHLSCGEIEQCHAESPEVELVPPKRVGGQFHVITFGEGAAGDFLDYEFARSIRDIDVEIFAPADFEIRQTHSGGFWLALFNLFGSDYDTIYQQANELRAKMLKRPELSPQLD